MSGRQLKTLGNDLLIVNGSFVVVGGEESIAQQAKQRLQTSQGEWRYDLSIGVPWVQQIADKVDLSVVRRILIEVLAGTPGVRRVESMDLDFDGSERTLTVSAVAIAETGGPVVLSNVEIDI